VRHGQDEDNAQGILNGHRNAPLTAKGRDQARVAGLKLAGKKINCIQVSPATRARQTAEIIADLIGIEELLVEPDLIERDFGVLTGKSMDEIARYAKQIVGGDRINYFLDGQGVEIFDDLLARARLVLRRLMAGYPNQRVLLVTHGAIGKMIEAAWHGWTWQQSLKTAYFENAEIIELKK
jgi:broad specificity phosphatase PhoE